MKSPIDRGQVVRIDPEAESMDSELPPFIAAPPDAPVYHGFPLLPQSRLDDFVFGLITEVQGDQPASWGDAFVVAPNGSRAGIVWQMGTGEAHEICSPNAGRWGVYGFYFQKPIRCDADLVAELQAVLPRIKAFYAEAEKRCPESVAPGPGR